MTHYEKAKLVRDEFKEVFGYQPPFPRSAAKLKELELELTDVN